MILESVNVGPMDVNCYILASKENAQAIIIDPGDQPGKINQILKKYKLRASFIINTHGHYDHIGADDKFGVPVYIHSEDLAFLKDPKLNLSAFFSIAYNINSEIKLLHENEIIGLDDIELKILHIPGHTPGGVALQMIKPIDSIVFSGDTLFCHGLGRSDLEGGDEALLIKSIKEKLFSLSDETIVYPGHGPSSTIGDEKRNNPFFNEQITYGSPERDT